MAKKNTLIKKFEPLWITQPNKAGELKKAVLMLGEKFIALTTHFS